MNKAQVNDSIGRLCARLQPLEVFERTAMYLRSNGGQRSFSFL